MKQCFIVLFCLLPGFMAQPVFSWAQGRDNIWVFGRQVALDFSSGNPVQSCVSLNFFLEGCASICDTNGHLLFYTNGQSVFDKTYQEMPNGNNLLVNNLIETFSTTQGTVILPIPCSDTKYYVFSLGNEFCAGQLCYSMVDMSLNGGLGGLDTNTVGILLDTDSLTEKMTVVAGTNQNVWLLVRSRWVNEYKAYSISAAGIDTTPVISHVGHAPLKAYEYGTLKGSPDNSMLATALPGGEFLSAPFVTDSTYVELYDFNNQTGVISNARIIERKPMDSSDHFGYYGVCFSPDNTKLYVSKTRSDTQSNFPGQVIQFDVSSPNVSNVIASRSVIKIFSNATIPLFLLNIPYPGRGPTDMKIGPDGKMYVSIPNTTSIDRINHPNLAGIACDYESQALFFTNLPTSGINAFGCLWGLPAKIVVLENHAPSGTKQDIAACRETTLHSPQNSNSYLWNTGATSSEITVTESGTYWVKSILGCGPVTDSFEVNIYTPVQPLLGDDTVICRGESIGLYSHVGIPASFSLLWNTGSTSSSINVSDSGTYWLTSSLPPCVNTDSITIGLMNCNCVVLMPNAFSPNGDGKNDVFKPINDGCRNLDKYVLRVFNRWGQMVFVSYAREDGWDGTLNGKPLDIGSYYYTISYKDRNRAIVQKNGDITLLR